MSGREFRLRSKEGHLKAEFVERIARGIFMNINGHWELRGKAQARAYVIDTDSVFTASGQQVRVFLWEGDYLIETC